jgi:hypothetical protein
MTHDPGELLAAIQKGGTKAVDRLLEAGASPNTRVFGTTPLITAVCEQKNAIALRLIAAGADVDATNERGDTALYWATNKRMPDVAAAILAAPGEPLAHSRRILDSTPHDRTEPPACIAAAEAFATAVANGADITAHISMLFYCYQYFPHSWTGTREQLEGAICLHVLRSGDGAAIKRLENEARSGDGLYRGDLAFAHGFAFADRHGAELRPLYPLLIERLGDAVYPLDIHLQAHPERLEELAGLILAQAPPRLPRLLSSFSSRSWEGDASPAAAALVRLLRSDDSDIRQAAAQALQAFTKRRVIDLTPAAAGLAVLISGGRDTELAAELLARWALGQSPADWSSVDGFCLHDLEDVRKGALQALFWEWTEGTGAPEITGRLAGALMDEAPPVRQKAGWALGEGRRLLKPFSPIALELLASLVAALTVPVKAEGVAEFLAEYVRSEHRYAAELLPLLRAASSSNGGKLVDLTTICQQIAEGRHVAPCSICRHLGDEVSWGEEMVSGGGFSNTDPPPQFARLERLNREQYRCPECGTYYTLHEGGGSFLNAEWTNWTLTRVTGLGAEAPWVQTHELIRRGDFGGLERTLLRAADPKVQMETVATLETRVVEGVDITPLEPTLRELLTGELLSGTNDLARAAATLLTRHLLGKGEQLAAVEGLLGSDRLDVRLGTLYALNHAALEKPAELRSYLDMVRPFLGSDAERVRSCAEAIVWIVGLQKEEAAATVADAIRRLESPRAEERATAASILSQAAEKGVADIRPALPRLAALWHDKNATWSEKSSTERAIKHAGGEWEYLGGILGLVERLRTSGRDNEVHTLIQMHERGEDISPAFEALATKAGSWPLLLLKRAAIQGDDLSAAVAPLRKLVQKADQEPANVFAACEARAAVGILACHYFFRNSWVELAAVLSADGEHVRGGVREIAGELEGLVWGKQCAQGERRRQAAAALAFLSVWADRSERVSLAFELELPDGVIAGILEGLLAAAKSGMDVERFSGRLRKLKNQPLAAEIVAVVKPEPLRPVERTEWHSGGDHCRVTDTEVVCWSGEGSNEVGASCSLQEFLEGKMQEGVRSGFGAAVFREVLNAVKSKTQATRERPRRSQTGARGRGRRRR